jgi:hypothetical protein
VYRPLMMLAIAALPLPGLALGLPRERRRAAP